MPDYTGLDSRWSLLGLDLVRALKVLGRMPGRSYEERASALLREAGAVPADLPNPMGMGAHDPVSGDAAVLEESITSGTPLRVTGDEDEETPDIPFAHQVRVRGAEAVAMDGPGFTITDHELISVAIILRRLDAMTPDRVTAVLTYIAGKYGYGLDT